MHTHTSNLPATCQSSTPSTKNYYKLKEYYCYKVKYTESRLRKQLFYLHFLALVFTIMHFIAYYFSINPLPHSVPIL